MRSVPEWIGRTDDTPVPPRVKLRVYQRADGNCAKCGNEGWAGEYDHAIPLIIGGENRESNIQLLCVPCHREKTKLDVKLKAKVARVRKKHLGIHAKRKPFPGSRASGLRKRMDGTVERRS